MKLTPHQKTLINKSLAQMPNGEQGLQEADFAKELQSVWDWAKQTGASEQRIIEEIIDTLSDDNVIMTGNTRGRGFNRAILDYDGKD